MGAEVPVAAAAADVDPFALLTRALDSQGDGAVDQMAAKAVGNDQDSEKVKVVAQALKELQAALRLARP
eukprot:4029831-Alexandrium_andersonii.AAC.1